MRRSIDLQAEIKCAYPHRSVERRGRGRAGSQIVTTTMGRAIFNEAINSVLPPRPGAAAVPQRGRRSRRPEEDRRALIRRYGNEDTAQVLDAIKRMGFRYATQSGMTIAIADITMPTEKDGSSQRPTKRSSASRRTIAAV